MKNSDLPSPKEIRALVAYVRAEFGYTSDGLVRLVDTKQYDTAQQLVGAISILHEMEELADGLDSIDHEDLA